MLVHPHWGYLCKFTNKEYTLNEIIDFYNAEFVSSHYRIIGKVILIEIGYISKQDICIQLLENNRY